MWLAKRNSFIVYPVAAALLLTVAVSSASAQRQPLIADIVVRGVQYTSADAILDQLKDILNIGAPYTEQAKWAAQAAIKKMGYYAEVVLAHRQVGEDVEVVITVVEHQHIEQIVFVGNTVVTDEELGQAITSQVGHIAVPTDVRESPIRADVEKIQRYYERQGYIAQVAHADIDDFGVLIFVINEAYIEEIVIEGLEKTEEWVVRRQVKTRPGELFRRERITQDLNRIFNMGLFKDVELADVRLARVPPDQPEPSKASVIPVIGVEEKPTGMVSIAAAYSELDRFVAMLSVSENNLRGRAERGSLDLELFGRTSYDFKFYEPYLDVNNTELNFNVFDTERQRRFIGGAAVSLAEDEFEERRTGATIGLARPMTETEKVSVGLRTEQVSSSFLQASRSLGGTISTLALPGSGGSGPGYDEKPIVVAAPLHPGGRVNSFNLGWHGDTRDIVANPTRGGYRSALVELAGSFLGGESTYQQYRWEQRRYLPMRGSNDVLALRLLLGTTTGSIPLFDSFSVGGANSLRGYQQDRYRGENMALFNAEYRYGLSDSLTVVGFVDAGDAYGGTFDTIIPGFTIGADDQRLDLHVGMGFGIRAVTPLGPLRLDFGFGEDGSQTHFGFGHTF